MRERLRRGLQYPGVHWLGETTGPEPLLGRIDMLCMPSSWEGQPLAALEAMAAGVLVVASDIPSLAELLGGAPAAGLTLATDPALWAAQIAALAADTAGQDSRRAEALRRVREEHRLDQMLDRIESAYGDALAAAGRR